MESKELVSDDLDDNSMELADEKSLFRLLSLLDGKLPFSSSILSATKAALSTDHTNRVYFKRRRNHQMLSRVKRDEADDFSVILGVREEIISKPNEQIKKVWCLTSWHREETDLVSAITSLKQIHWDQDTVLISSPNRGPSQELQRYLSVNKDQIRQEQTYTSILQFYIPIEKAVSLELGTPDEVYVQSLGRCHAQTVYDHWIYKDISSVERIADKIEAFPSAGVFLKSSNELVSWMLLYPPFGMGNLQTRENHRRKGYATLATRYLAKRVAQAGLVPTVYIHPENGASEEFFKSNNFEMLQLWQVYELHQVV